MNACAEHWAQKRNNSKRLLRFFQMQTVFYNKNTAFVKAGCLFADDELTILWQ